jgi:hypothetical protein
LIEKYFFASIDEGGGLDNREDDEEDVAVGICEGSQSIVLFLASCVPESQGDHTSIDLDGGGIVVEDCGDILGREPVLGVAV